MLSTEQTLSTERTRSTEPTAHQNPRPKAPEAIEIDGWRLELASGDLTNQEDRLRLEPKLAGVLAALAARPRQVVSKQELLDEVWPDTIVTEDVIWRAVSELRRILGDDSRAPRLIETLPRRGYRLMVAVERPRRVAEKGRDSRRCSLTPAARLRPGGRPAAGSGGESLHGDGDRSVGLCRATDRLRGGTQRS